MVDRTLQTLPGNKQLIKATGYLLNLLIHHVLRCPCPPLTSPVYPSLPPVQTPHVFPSFVSSFARSPQTSFFFQPILSLHSNDHISAHPQREMLSVWALKMSHTALFTSFLPPLFFLGPPPLCLPSIPFSSLPLSCPPSSLCL